MNDFDRVRRIADAVLFEGYALYPYRPTSQKNRLRWQFGVLASAALLLLVLERSVVLTLLLAGAAGALIAIAGGPLP